MVSRYSSPPKWLRNFFSGFMGRLLCLGNYYHQVSDTHQRLELDDVRESPESEQIEQGESEQSWSSEPEFCFRPECPRAGRGGHHEGLGSGGSWHREVLLLYLHHGIRFSDQRLHLVIVPQSLTAIIIISSSRINIA